MNKFLMNVIFWGATLIRGALIWESKLIRRNAVSAASWTIYSSSYSRLVSYWFLYSYFDIDIVGWSIGRNPSLTYVPPYTCMPNSANIIKKRKSSSSKLIMDVILARIEAISIFNPGQYLGKNIMEEIYRN